MTDQPPATAPDSSDAAANAVREGVFSRRRLKRAGLAAVAGVALGLGIAAGRGALDDAAPDSAGIARIEATSIAGALAESGAGDRITALTRADGRWDILLFAAPDCPHCQDFVADGLAGLVAFAKTEGLDLGYAPAALSPAGIAAEVSGTCVADAGRDPVAFLERRYAAAAELTAALRALRTDLGPQVTVAAYTDAMAAAIAPFHAAIGGEDFSIDCYLAGGNAAAQQISALSHAFGITATPSFVLRMPEGRPGRLVGGRDLAAMRALLD